MNINYFAVAFVALIGISLVSGQCEKGPQEWKRPEECCKFQLIKDTVFESCKDDGGDRARGNGKPPKGGPHPPGHGIKGSCRMECVFNNTRLYDGKQLNEDQIRKTFTAAVTGNDGLTKAVNAALDTCLPLAKSRTSEFAAAGEKCSPITMFLFMCVTGNIVAKCPAADFEANDATCVSLQNYFNKCPKGPQ